MYEQYVIENHLLRKQMLHSCMSNKRLVKAVHDEVSEWSKIERQHDTIESILKK